MSDGGTDAAVERMIRPGSLAPAGLRRVLVILCLTETISWGVLYYAFPVLAADISKDTGWSMASLTAAFSASLLVAALIGIPAGRRLDRVGPRGLMTAGSVLAACALAVVALAPNLAAFAAGWLAVGVAMAAVLYPPAFAALTRWFEEDRIKALTMLTLAAGLASTIFAPLTAFFLDRLDWRGAYLALAGILVITVPGHWWGLRGHWPVPEAHAARQRRDGRDRTARSLPFAALVTALGLASFAAYAVVINLVPLLIERGLDTGTAAIALGVGGVGQVVGRVAYPALTRRAAVRARTSLILLATASTTALLGVLTSTSTLIIAAILAGMARGLLTLVQATAITDRWGTSQYGRLTGLLSAPVTAAVAVAPWAGAVIASLVGSYTTAFLSLAALGTVSAILAIASVPRSTHATE